MIFQSRWSYLCMCMRTHTCTHAHMCLEVRGQLWMSSRCFLHVFFFKDKDLSLAWSSPRGLDWLASRPQESVCLLFSQNWKYKVMHPSVPSISPFPSTQMERLNSGPCDCKAIILPIELPLPPASIFISSLLPALTR